jgi:acyl transferase domain-containing protein
MMDSILEQFTKEVRKLRLPPPRIPFISSSTGTWITQEEATDPTYWAMQIRKAVRFNAGRQELAKIPDHILLEVGPGSTLTTFAKHPAHNAEQVVVASLASSRETHKDVQALLTALGHLWLEGVPVNWQEFYANERRYRVALPTYSFERKRYWIDPPKIAIADKAPQSPSDASESPTEPAVQPSQSFAVNPSVTENSRVDEVSGSTVLFERVMSQQLQIMERQLEVLTYCQVSDEDSTPSLLILEDQGDGRRRESLDNGQKPEGKVSIEENLTEIK